MQAYKLASKKSVIAPGNKITRTIIPRDDLPPNSKRGDIIEEAENVLETEMDNLKDGTRQRNKEIEERFNAIKERCVLWENKLLKDVQEREIEHNIFNEKLRQRFEALNESFLNEIHKTFDSFEAVNFPTQDKRMDHYQDDFHTFVDLTVPGIIEDLQGNITRRLKKSHETFEIDCAKLMKREIKIVNKFENHQARTSIAFEDEKNTRFIKLLTMEETINQTMRSDDRQSEKNQAVTMTSIRCAREEFQELQAVRQKEDLEVLGKLGDAMAKLQHSIMTNFGNKNEG